MRASALPPRRSQSQRPLNTATRDLERINTTLSRLYSRIEGKLAECRIGEAEASELVSRAERINNRLDVLRVKLRHCYESSGIDTPANLHVVLRQMTEIDADDAPSEFVCPISQCLMVDPVKTCDQQVYDRASIVEWFATFSDGRLPTSPLTNLPLETTDLTPALDLRMQIQQFMMEKQRGKRIEEPSRRNDVGAAAAAAGALPSAPSTQAGRATPPPASNPATALLLLPSAAAVSAAMAPPRGGRPIWSSSVVPAGEDNSRELNFLRVSELAMPDGMILSSPLASNGARGGTDASRLVARSSTLPSAVPVAASRRMPPVARATRSMLSAGSGREGVDATTTASAAAVAVRVPEALRGRRSQPGTTPATASNPTTSFAFRPAPSAATASVGSESVNNSRPSRLVNPVAQPTSADALGMPQAAVPNTRRSSSSNPVSSRQLSANLNRQRRM